MNPIWKYVADIPACSKFSPFYTTVINVVFWTVSLVPATFTVWGVEGVKTYEDPQDSGVEEVTVEPAGDEKKNEASRV